MKSYKNLWPQIVAFENLLEAARKAQRGKRMRPDVAAFNARIEENLLELQDELQSGVYVPGPYRTWTVYERKPRLICAAPYRDRVVHHAFCNIVEPLFERSFIDDTYACRVGKGTHASMRRVRQHAQRYGYVLRLDVRRYFSSIDQTILRARLARRIADTRVMALVGQILATYDSGDCVGLLPGDDLVSAADRPIGLPVGNQTGQFFSNVYLDGFDHFIKEELRCPGYVRYVDDLALFADSKEELREMLGEAEAYLLGLRLRLHPRRRQVAPVTEGIGWVGYRVFPTHVRLRNDNPHNFRRRFRQ
ncbi:MAG: RNA-dependent DNA polymerase, partial [Rubrivivax sp.]|nr:RNA-dependent DNA polymerase [Rubrivivax sp.]